MALLDGLLAYWTMDEAGGNRADSHGANHLVDHNTVESAAGKINLAADFEIGANEYFTVADNADVSFSDEDFTYMFWVKPESLSAGSKIVLKDAGGGGNREYQCGLAGTYNKYLQWLIFDAAGAGLVGNVTSLSSLTAGVWDLIFLWNDTVLNQVGVQFNLEAPTIAATSGPGPKDAAANLHIGGADGGGYNWDGLIDESALWGKVLTPDEKTLLYNDSDGYAYPFIFPPARMRNYRRKRIAGKVTVYD